MDFGFGLGSDPAGGSRVGMVWGGEGVASYWLLSRCRTVMGTRVMI